MLCVRVTSIISRSVALQSAPELEEVLARNRAFELIHLQDEISLLALIDFDCAALDTFISVLDNNGSQHSRCVNNWAFDIIKSV